MINIEKENVNKATQRNNSLLRLGNGLKGVITDWKKALILMAYIVAVLLIWMYRWDIFGISYYSPNYGIGALYSSLLGFLLPTLALIGMLLLIGLLGTPLRSFSVRNSMRRIGLLNHAGEAPLLVSINREKQSGITIMEFLANGMPMEEWGKKRSDIETELNIHIARITEGKDKRHILLYTVHAKGGLSDKLYWQDTMLSKKEFEIVLGESLLGQETVNLCTIPHVLIGGSTGSGKSVLLKSVLMQCVKKGAQVCIADFKGGVDYIPVWNRYCRLITDENKLTGTLDEIVNTLELRKTAFRSVGCKNLNEYNRQSNKKLRHIVFACDEVAELLDKTGLDKAGKERVALYENRLATIARQGRAFGIHLMLATQRPDANILSGQIKNNIDCRICGRADNVLSQIILDNTTASDAIPKDAQGRFIMVNGTVFQGYLFDEKTIFMK